MGIFGKLLPWKRKDDLGLSDNLGLGGFGQPMAQPGQDLGLGLGPAPYEQQPGMGGQFQQFGSQRPQMEAFQQERSYAANKDIEVVSAKLDAIKSALEALNQRLANIERYIQLDQDFKKRGGW
ncbi:hypothetical protein HYU18_01540 [Candidatus Woesearchaeota archaeon]|nr:hypothetical protein [Candidatus Woesearchaeota archaeon]